MAEDLGLVWLHVVSPPRHRERPHERLGELGQLRRRRPDRGAGSELRLARQHAREPEPRPRGALPGVDRPHLPRQPAGAELQAHAACRTCRGSTCPPGACTGASRTTRSRGSPPRPTRTRASSTCCSSGTSSRRGFADFELQQLWKRLKAKGLWDESLIVVAADHGVAFPQARERRRLSRQTAREIAPVPLIIKAPGPEEGQGQRRLGRDHRHPADDLRHPEPRPAREDGRQVGVQRRGEEPRHAALRDPQHLPDAPDPRRPVQAQSASRSSSATTACSGAAPTAPTASTRSARTPS